MAEIEKQVAYWRSGAEEDFDVAKGLVASGRVRHGLFFAHLALEKALKAHVCRCTRELAPRIHNLVRLLEQTGLTASEEHQRILAVMNAFNLEGRYPNSKVPVPDRAQAEAYLARSGEALRWLMSQL